MSDHSVCCQFSYANCPILPPQRNATVSRTLCLEACPALPLPTPSSKRGRYKQLDWDLSLSPDLFLNGRNHPFASCLGIWEMSNILAQRTNIAWDVDQGGNWCYRREVKGEQNAIAFHITQLPNLPKTAPLSPNPTDYHLPPETATEVLKTFDLRAVCLHLIYAAYATTLHQPWQEEFVVSSDQLETYLGLDKRKDLTKAAKLLLLKQLAFPLDQITVSLHWPQRGPIPPVTVEEDQIWHLVEMQHHCIRNTEEESQVVGLTFRIRPGRWAHGFLNRQKAREKTAYFQRGVLPLRVLQSVMRYWQQHEGAMGMLVWLLFKLRVGPNQPVKVETLMGVAYGSQGLKRAKRDREWRKTLLHRYEGDLETLTHCGVQPVFDSQTYPVDIQPFWAKVAAIPEESEAAVDFWIADAQNDQSITAASPRKKWQRLMKARIAQFNLAPDWQKEAKKPRLKRQRKRKPETPSLTREQIREKRRQKGWSQRDLAQFIGKSQSWVRDIEKGRLSINPAVQQQLRELLDESSQ
ncbi:helix-turn-helix domain-containing protein [Spirulina sp. CS-785/01]|uniref:helix-turn-helix domain-containing protein n=1 Tax=Spirulina sp. CS-785/01 TaxID=3021716 RepID=UPI00232C02D8|nr:helix-turn-helix domain-containing protein [Spirulina sp. CS-785/01]MDB9313703.1 helix-turn-helix domain-containing protein [Spirulina sp. CS-785/01]